MSQALATASIDPEPTLTDTTPCPALSVALLLRRALFALLVVGLLLGGESRAAPVVFDPANYTNLVSSGSSEIIEPGTQITLQNWQHYKRYLPFGIQVLYSGQYLWHVGGTPDFTITVGPTIDYTWPRRYLEDTEKYGDHTRLEKLESGGSPKPP